MKQHRPARHIKHVKKVQKHVKRQAIGLHRAVKHDLLALTPMRIIEGLIVLTIAVQMVVYANNFFSNGSPVLGLQLEGHVIGRLKSPDSPKQAATIINTHEDTAFTVAVGDQTSSISLHQL